MIADKFHTKPLPAPRSLTPAPPTPVSLKEPTIPIETRHRPTRSASMPRITPDLRELMEKQAIGGEFKRSAEQVLK